MSKIEQLPSGKYRIRVSDHGKRKSITADSKNEVKRLAAEYLYMSKRPPSEMTVGEAIEAYISDRESVLSPSTIHGYRKIQRNHFKDIEYYNISVISNEDIQVFIDRLSRTASPKTVKNVYGLLISSIRAFLPDRHINVRLPQKKPIERHIPTSEDVVTLLRHSDGDLMKAIILASTGTLRRGEICSLSYEDITGNVIHVHTDMVISADGKNWVVKEIPKTTSSDRYIEFPENVIKELGTGTGRIIKVKPQTITQAFIRLRNKYGIDCRFHDLRHYAASIMHAIGVPDQYIMDRGGWASDVTLKSVYRNVLDDKRNEFTDKTNEFLSGLLTQ